MTNIKYCGSAIVMEEVPDEISLAISITGCQHSCVGCHSPYLHDDTGLPLNEHIDTLIEPYKDMITCVCFMGGDQNIDELVCMCDYVRAKYKLKTCVYSGYDYLSSVKELLMHTDYLKIGSYQSRFGGLASPTTNQRMYQIDTAHNGEYIDITNKFWRNNNDANKN